MPNLFVLFVTLVSGLFAYNKIVRKDDPETPQDETEVAGIDAVATDIIGAVAGPVAGVLATVVQAVEDTGGTIVAAVFGTKYDDLINASAIQFGLDPRTLYNLLYSESHFRPDIISGRVTSSVGAIGIAQFMPATAIEELGSIEAAKDPEKAIPGAARYLAKLIKSTGSIDAGVAAYNWGVGNVKRKGLANAPKETLDYVAAITGGDISKG